MDFERSDKMTPGDGRWTDKAAPYATADSQVGLQATAGRHADDIDPIAC